MDKIKVNYMLGATEKVERLKIIQGADEEIGYVSFGLKRIKKLKDKKIALVIAPGSVEKGLYFSNLRYCAFFVTLCKLLLVNLVINFRLFHVLYFCIS